MSNETNKSAARHDDYVLRGPYRLTEDESHILAQALFEEEERMLPEGQTWAGLDSSDKSFYKQAAVSVVLRLCQLRSR
jgi:hypothetical protein